MDSKEIAPKLSEESVTLRITKSSRNTLFAKIGILICLTLLGGTFFARQGAQQYEKGIELTQEKYLERFEEYKGSLLNSKQYDNPFMAIFATFMVLSFLIGSYELSALSIGFLIGKVIKR